LKRGRPTGSCAFGRRDAGDECLRREQGEQSRFGLGESTLRLANLREQATVDAALREVDALAYDHRAAAYRAAPAEKRQAG
jgi:outer membrane protein, heavy metal efflux system